VRMVADSTEETSIGLTLEPITVTAARLVASPLTKSTVEVVPTTIETGRGDSPLRLIWYWPVGSCAKR